MIIQSRRRRQRLPHLNGIFTAFRKKSRAEDRGLRRTHRLLTSEVGARQCCLSRPGVGATMIFAGLWNSSGSWNSKGPRRSRSLPGRPWRDARRESRRRIRALAAEVDAIANNGGTAQAVAALEQRVNVLVHAVNTSRAAGEVLPRDLEKLLARLVRKLKRARVKRARRPYGFAQAAGNVVVGVSFAFSLFVGLHILDGAGLFDEIVSFLAEQAQSLRSAWSLAEARQMVARANQVPLATPSLPAPHAATGTSAGAGPSATLPEITGALPRTDSTRSVPPVPGRSAAIVEDKLPATIGNPALRAAAMAGDPAAAYEVASRFAEGRGVAQSHEEEARWLERAANARAGAGAIPSRRPL